MCYFVLRLRRQSTLLPLNMYDNYICESICCTQSVITPTPSNWVDTVYLAAAPNQLSCVLKAVTCLIWVRVFPFFFPSTCQDTGSRRRDQNKVFDWSALCHQLMVVKNSSLKGPARIIISLVPKQDELNIFSTNIAKYFYSKCLFYA